MNEKNKQKILLELNKQSEEALQLFISGKQKEAIILANHVLNTARKELGKNHPYINIYYDNLVYIKNNSKSLIVSKNTSNVNIQTLKHNYIYKQNRPYENKLTTFDDNIDFSKYLDKSKKINIKYIILAFIIAVSFIFFVILGSIFNYIPNKTINLNPNINLQSIELFSDFSPILKTQNLIDAPLVLQNPELPRGCEIASLTMLLNHAGINVDKLTLAEEIKKDTSKYQIIDGRIYFGHPNYGFVGDIYSLNNPGLGVYHDPIKDLADKYLPNQTIDLTGRSFEDLLYFLSNDIPVWVITNATYDELSENYFKIWYTSYGPIQITYKQHSVLITGYNDEYVYFNDPLINQKNQKAPIDSFEKAWEQMGRQAISYIPQDRELTSIIPIK